MAKRLREAAARWHKPATLRRRRSAARLRLARSLVIVVLGTLVAAGLAYGGVKLATDPRFALDQVEVTGAQRTGADRVLAAAQLSRGSNVWLIDVSAVQDRIASLPWVESARVVRGWPNELALVATERAPVARLLLTQVPAEAHAPPQAPAIALVDTEGRILQVGGLEPADERLPLVSIEPPLGEARAGERLESEALRGALEAEARVSALGVHISEVASEPVTGISITTDSRLRVIFGDGQELERKVALFLAIAQRITHPDQVSYIDVRSTSAPTVQYRQ